ncbi:hypothetical protein [Absidia glauca]|uniref:CBF1-interacting co-repressor CIR N-terminal domain-containing protein n=1 Tax=Absidia glauca TaxID=4829 RepID=A0A163JSA8_ABSGL|nr:hypothetical protein [Absidia glauca]
MNILPHKSWHVYNKKNIEKVRKDEAKAKTEQEAKDKRALVADSEVRLKLLRQRASTNQVDQEGQVGPVRLFAEAEKEAMGNEEVKADEKTEKDRMNKQITMYLEAKDEEAPWYSKKGHTKYTDDHLSKPYLKSKHDKDRQKRHKRPPITLHHDDPLEVIKSHLDKDEKKKDRHHSHHRKHKKSDTSTSKPPSIEELRALRKQREDAERLRTRSVIYGDTHHQHQDPRQQRYNSQYNRTETDQAHQSKKQRQHYS